MAKSYGEPRRAIVNKITGAVYLLALMITYSVPLKARAAVLKPITITP
jgi:hypothetical protein